jgi:two-component system, NtrC family, nitrogen regulation sensor histidine kinase NtrY
LNAFLKNIFQKNVYILVAVIILCLAAWGVNIYLGSNASVRSYSNSIQKFLQQRETDFNDFLKDSSLIFQLENQEYSQKQLDELIEKKYAVFIYETGKGYKLNFWNDQRAVLPPDSLLRKKDTSYFCTLDNGQYQYVSATVRHDNKTSIRVVALIPVHWQYYIANSNLQPEFVHFPDAETKVGIALHQTKFPVKSISGNILFYLEKKGGYSIVQDNWLSQLLIAASFFLLVLILHNLANSISNRYGAFKGIMFLISVVFILRMIVYMNPSVLNLRQYELFDPKIYGSNFVLRSLGDLLINSLLFCWIVFFVKQTIGAYTFPNARNSILDWIQSILVLFALVVSTFVFANIVQSLITDARIAFSVTNFFSLTIYSFIGFIVLAALALSYFFLSQILLQLISNMIRKNNLVTNIIIAVIGLLLLTFGSDPDIVQLDIFVLIWLLVYIWLLQRQALSGLNLRLNVSEVLFWLFVFSVSISTVIIFENHKIELEQRKRTAERLSEEADPSSEKVLSIALTYIDNDFLPKNFERFANPSSNVYLKDSIINNNYIAYRHNYDTKIYTYDSAAKPLFNETPVSYDTLNTIFNIQGKDLNVQGVDTNVTGLRYYAKSFDKLIYIYKKTVKDKKNKLLGYFFILSEPKNYKDDALLVPELFQQQRELLPEYAQAYSYAIYNDGKLIQYYNNYQFPTQLLESDIPKTDFVQRRYGQYDELWHLISDNKIVVIVKKDNSILEAITLFAYLFTAFLILLSIFRIASIFIRTRLQWSRIRSYLQLNIRSQIHTTIIFVSLFSFIVIGIATILFFISRYNRSNQEQLNRSKQIMLGEIQSKLDERVTYNDSAQTYYYGSKDALNKLIDNVSTIHSIDVNLYDIEGNLIVSSNPFVYNKGILNEKMNPIAYYNIHNLNSVEFFNDEEIGKVSYLSIYAPLRDESGEAYGYLNIPSFRTEDELKEEISKFLVTIINLNAFIFLVAGTIALFLTNKITSSFTLISNKMRDINLGKTNEEIVWKRNDEIGELVKEYNTMVRKLEQGAAVLAKSERESAWREMARQVAHEIKNPLTPMKLSIQYLQKAIDNNSPNIKELTAGVANTLVEQIDHLSKIAADFSQFANIGNPRNEIFDLHEMLRPLTALYETTENILFKWVPVHEKILVNADKTQLNRLFTNLLQNAVEACNKDKRIISVSEEAKEDTIVIKVTDNGQGIAPGTQSKIFIPNFTTKSSGTGLGLAMSKTIVEQAKGKIWFTTQVGEGTTFYVELPTIKEAI